MKSKAFSPLVLILVLAVISTAFPQPPPTNEELVVNSVRTEVNQSFDKDSNRALLVISGQSELELLMAGGIADAMRSKYWQVMLAYEPSPQADNLTFSIQGFDFTFRKGASRGFLKAHKIRRDLQGQLRITVRSGMEGQLREMKDLPISYHDVIDPGWAKYVKSRNINELAPPTPSSGWSRYVEPALVITAVGTLVYLFFANR